MGIEKCDNMLMILAASTDMPEREREICTKEMIRGFNGTSPWSPFFLLFRGLITWGSTDLAREAETIITGGQTVKNPWPIIGGTAMSACEESEFIRPEHLQVGDVVVLTKPLGTQVAVNAHQWLQTQHRWFDSIKDLLTREDILYAYNTAMHSMARLNRTGARLMHKYQAHGGTDVTGFGLLGHAINLAENQTAAVDIEIHTLPIIKKMAAVDDAVRLFKLCQGYSAETSGGLMVCLPAEHAQSFIDDIQQADQCEAWIIGRVVPRQEGHDKNSARITEDVTIVEV